MERDHQFEVQYLLTVTIAIVTFLASAQLQHLFDLWVGVLIIILLSVHIVLLNIVYVLQRVNKWQLEVMKTYRGYSEKTFVAITGAIPFLVLHAVLLGGSKMWGDCSADSIVDLAAGQWFHYCSGGITLIGYLVPLLVTAGVMGSFRRKIVPSLTLFRHINFVVAPPDLTIYSDYSDTEPLFVKVANSGKKTREFGIEIEFPEEVKWRLDNEWKVGSYSEDHSIKSDKRVRLDIELEYTGENRRSDVIAANLTHEYGNQEKTVPVQLEP